MTRRCVALVVDALLLACIPVATVAIVGHAEVRRGVCPDPIPAGRGCFSYREQTLLVDKSVFLVFVALLVVFYLAVFVVVQGLTGASPGKALLGIRVVRPDGSSAGVLRSIVRVLAWVIDGLALLVPVALWSAWFTPGHRRVGDWLAGTFVVRRTALANAARVVPDDHAEWLR